ncbi:MAG: hypothetical protein ACHQJ5_04245 [Vicinamibacteria bacterium]
MTPARERLPVALLALAAACSTALLVVLGARLYFYIDDWDLLLHRPGWTADALLEPHQGHPSMALVAAYKLLQSSFGMDSITPFTIAATLAFVASAIVLFFWLRRRVGDWLALAGAVSILFLGSAYEDLLIPFQLGFFAPMALGIGALLAFEREDRAGDAWACALLVAALAFQSLGLIFVVAIAVVLALQRRLRTRAWVVLVPAALYALWYVGWGRDDPSQLSFDNLATAPGFILDGFANSVSALLGLATNRDEAPVSPFDWGRPLLVLALVVAGIWVWRRRQFSVWLWGMVAAGVTFWFLIAINASEFRSADLSRYRYVGAIVVLMIVAELLRGVRVGTAGIVATFAVVANATLSHLSALPQDYAARLPSTAVIAGGLGALDIARDVADPALVLDQDNSDFAYYGLIDAGSYLAASAAYGSLGYSADELPAAPERARVAADKVLGAALGLRLQPISASAAGACEPVAMPGPESVPVPRGGTAIRVGEKPVRVSVRRYTEDEFPVELGRLDAGQTAALAIPGDGSSQDWWMQLDGQGSAQVCPLEPRA